MKRSEIAIRLQPNVRLSMEFLSFFSQLGVKMNSNHFVNAKSFIQTHLEQCKIPRILSQRIYLSAVPNIVS